MKLKLTRIIIFVWVSLSLAILFTPQVSAQQQATGDFSGSDLANYTCPPLAAYPGPYTNGKDYPPVSSDFMCRYICRPTTKVQCPSASLTTNASIRPPTLKVLQFWFLRVLYAAWALSGIVFTLILVWLGFRWMTSGGDPGVIGDVKKRAKNWFIGLALIFLSYPALTTLFNVIGLSESECFSELNLPAFQFFFPNACVAPGGTPAPTP